MNRLLVFFMIAYLFGQIVSFAMEGESAVAGTRLTASLSKTEISTANVITTDGFIATNDFFIVDEEMVCYATTTSATFVTLTRGCKKTKAEVHSTGSAVYNETMGLLNESVGFGLAESLSTAGGFGVIFNAPGMFKTIFPRLVAWDYSFFEGEVYGFPLIYFQAIGWVISAGLIFMVVMLLINVFMGIFRR